MSIGVQLLSMSPVEIVLRALEILKSSGHSNKVPDELKEYIFTLRSKIPEQFGETEEIAHLMDEIEDKFRLSKKHHIGSILNSLLTLLRPVDVNVLSDTLKRNSLTADVIKGKDIVLFVGYTGTGKTTILQYLFGAKMTESVTDGIPHLSSILPNTGGCLGGLEKFAASHLPKSETKSIMALQLSGYGDPIWFVDSPGFEDTEGVEADISNGLSISSAVKQSKSVRVVVLVSEKGVGDRGGGVEQLVKTLMRFADLSRVLSSFTFLFTKFQKSESQRIQAFLSQKLESLSRNMASCDTFCEILSAMIEQAGNDMFVVDPLRDDPKNLVHAILQSHPIDCPREIFKDFVSPESLSKLKNQQSLDSKFISLKIRYLEEVASTADEIDSAIAAISVKSTQLEDVKSFIRFDTAYLECKGVIERLTFQSIEALEFAITHMSSIKAHQRSENVGRHLYILLALDRSISYINVAGQCSTLIRGAVDSICALAAKDVRADIAAEELIALVQPLFSLREFILPYVNRLESFIEVFRYLDNECKNVLQYLYERRKYLVESYEEMIRTKQYCLGVMFLLDIQSLTEILSQHAIREEVTLTSIGVVESECQMVIERLNLADFLEEEQIKEILNTLSQLREISSRQETACIIDASNLFVILSSSVDTYLLKSISLVQSLLTASVDQMTLQSMEFVASSLRQANSFCSGDSPVENSLAIEYQQVLAAVKYCLHGLFVSGRDIIKSCCGPTDHLQQVLLMLIFSSSAFLNLSAPVYSDEFELLICELLLAIDTKRLVFAQKSEFECLRLLSDAFESIQFIRECENMFHTCFPVLAVPATYASLKTSMHIAVDVAVASEQSTPVSEPIFHSDLESSGTLLQNEHSVENSSEILTSCSAQSDKRNKHRGRSSAKKHAQKRNRTKKSHKGCTPLALVEATGVTVKNPLITSNSSIIGDDDRILAETCLECGDLLKRFNSAENIKIEPPLVGDCCTETVAGAITVSVQYFDFLLRGIVSFANEIINVPMKYLVLLCRRWSGFNEEANRLIHSHRNWTALFFEQLQICMDKSFGVILSSGSSSFSQRKEETERVLVVLGFLLDHKGCAVANEDDLGYSSHQIALRDTVLNGHLNFATALLSDASVSSSTRWETASCCVRFDRVGMGSTFQQHLISLEIQCQKESHGQRDQLKMLIERKRFDQAFELLTVVKNCNDIKSKELYESLETYSRGEILLFRQRSLGHVNSIVPSMVKDFDCVFKDVSVILEDVLLTNHPFVQLLFDDQYTTQSKPDDLTELFLKNMLAVIPRIKESLTKRLFLQVASWEYQMDQILDRTVWQNSDYSSQINDIRKSRRSIDVEAEINTLLLGILNSMPRISTSNRKNVVINRVAHTLSEFKKNPPRDILHCCAYLIEHSNNSSNEDVSNNVRAAVTALISSVIDAASAFLVGIFADKETRQKLFSDHAAHYSFNGESDCPIGIAFSASEKANMIDNLEKVVSYVSADVKAEIQPLFLDCRTYCKYEHETFEKNLKSFSDNKQFQEIIDICREALVLEDQTSTQLCLSYLIRSMQGEICLLQSKIYSRDLSSYFALLPDIWQSLDASFSLLAQCEDFLTGSIRDQANNIKIKLAANISRLSELVSSALDFKSMNFNFHFNVAAMVSCFQWMKEYVFLKAGSGDEMVSLLFTQIAASYPEWIHVDEKISNGFDGFLDQFLRCDHCIQQTLKDLATIDMTNRQRKCALEKVDDVLSSYANLSPLLQSIADFIFDPRTKSCSPSMIESFQKIPSFNTLKTRLEIVLHEWAQDTKQELLYNTELVESVVSSFRDEFFKKQSRIYLLLRTLKPQLAKYGLAQDDQGYYDHFNHQLRTILTKVTAMIPNFPGDDSDLVTFNNVSDILRSFKDNFQDFQLQGCAKAYFDEIHVLLKKRITEVLENRVDAELSNENVSDISYEDVVDTIIDIKNMALGIIIFQDGINGKIDVSLAKCKKSVNGNKKIGMLSVELNSRESTDSKGNDGLAQRIIAEHRAFKGFALSLRNTKTVNFTIAEVLQGLQLESALADEIRAAYQKFEAEFWRLVESGLGNVDRKCDELVAEVSNCSQRLSSPLTARVLFYVVRIFAYWTLSNASDFLEAVEVDGEEEHNYRTNRCPRKLNVLMDKVRQIIAASTSHETLLLNESTASNADIKKSYRKLSLLLHPDKLNNFDEPLSEEAKGLCCTAYLRIKEAHEKLVSKRKEGPAGQVDVDGSSEGKKKQARSYVLQPHAAQVVSVLLFFAGAANKSKASELKFSNQFIQIGTGEGKSITLAVTSCVLALLGFDVDCACYSEYLSSRDEEAFENIFRAFGLSGHIKYGTYDTLAESFVNSGFADDGIRGAVEEYIRRTGTNNNSSRMFSSVIANVSAAASFLSNIMSSKEARPRVLLIDEVDVFFSSNFYGNSYNPVCLITHPTISDLFHYIYDRRSLSNKDLYRDALASAVFKQCLDSFPRWQELLHEALKKMIFDLNSLDGHEYKVVMGKIGYLEHDGVTFSIFYGYVTLFAYLKEHLRGSIDKVVLEENLALSIRCGRFSFGEVPKLYHSIMGVSGTLSSLSECEQNILRDDVHIEKMVYMPSIFGPNQLQFAGNSTVGVKIVSEQSAFHLEVVNEIKTRLIGLQRSNTKRAVLVFFRSTAALTAFMSSDEYGRSGLKEQVHIITEETTSAEREALIRHAATSNAVTLLTRPFGRGTDFVCYDEKLQAAGGVHVLATFLSEQVSEETQMKGRTARQGNQGSFSMVLLASELERDFKISAAEVQQMISTDSIYDSLHRKRMELQDSTFPTFVKKIADSRSAHEEAQQFVQDLLNDNETAVRAFLLQINKCQVSF